jgi:cell division control protein 6
MPDESAPPDEYHKLQEFDNSMSSNNRDGLSGQADELFGDEIETVFENKELLRIGHIPGDERIIGRDDQIQKISKLLESAVLGNAPSNGWIFGKTGTGKTLCSRHVTRLAQNKAKRNDVRLGAAYVDCSEDSSPTQVLTTACNQLNNEHETGISIPDAGLGESRLYKRLWRVIDRLYDTTLIIIDEVDMLTDEEDSLLRNLCRAEENKNTNTPLGVLAISNKVRYLDNLNERAASSFQQTDVNFPSYDANQLRKILRRREDAFKDNVLVSDVIPLSASIAAQDHGDARKALDVLRTAGELADRNDSTTVTIEHVRNARKISEKVRTKQVIDGLPRQSQIVLLALGILTLQNESQEAFSTREVYQMYEQITKAGNMNSLTSRSVRTQLDEHEFLGVVDAMTKSSGKARGIQRFHSLIDDPKVVVEAADTEGLIATLTENKNKSEYLP